MQLRLLRLLRISHDLQAPMHCSIHTGASLEFTRQTMGLAKGFLLGVYANCLGLYTLLSNEGAGKPGCKSSNEKCTSDVGTLKTGALTLEGCALADACRKGDS